MMRRFATRAAVVAAVLAAAAWPGATADAAQRTFVASYGSDANACTRVLPCRSFASAIGHTDDGGEIIVLDSAGYGPVVVTRSVSLIAPGGVYAGVSVFGGHTGVVVDGAGIRVTLRGLAINGLSATATGVEFAQGAALYVERCVFGGAYAYGVLVRSPGEVFLDDVTVRGGNIGAISAEMVHAPDVVRLTIARAHLTDSYNGLYVYGNVRALLTDSVVAGNATNGVAASGVNGNDLAEIVVHRTAVVHNLRGVYSGVSPGALGLHRIVVDDSTVAWNSIGWNVRDDANTQLYTRGNNVVRFNTDDMAGKAAVALTGN